MRRVLLLVTDLQPGGTPLRIVRIARELPRYGFEPVVGCLVAEGPLSGVLREAGIGAFACGARHRLDVSCLGRLAKYIRHFDPDLIHSTLFHANLAARLVGTADRARPIVTGSATIEVERRLHLIGEALTAGWSDWHVANSRSVARHVCEDLGFPRDRVVVVPNPVDLARIDAARAVDRSVWGIPTDKPMLLWAGRMDVVKGLDVVIEAIELVRRERACSLVLCGDGPERSRVEARVRGMREVFLVGWQSELAGWLKAADVLVFPSLTEGSPNVVLEAMAAGCAVVASDIPACRELIEPGRNGALASVGAAGSFAVQLVRLLNDREFRHRIGSAARQTIEVSHTVGTVMPQLSGFYQLILDR